MMLLLFITAIVASTMTQFLQPIVVSSTSSTTFTTTFSFLLLLLLPLYDDSHKCSISAFTATTTTTTLSLVHFQPPAPTVQRNAPHRILRPIGCSSTTTTTYKRQRRRRFRSPYGGDFRHYGNRRGGDDEEEIEFDASLLDGIRQFDPNLRWSRTDDVLGEETDEIDTDVLEEMEYLRNELVHLESLEDLIQELEQYSMTTNELPLGMDGDEDDVDMEELSLLWDEESLDELLNNLPPSSLSTNHTTTNSTTTTATTTTTTSRQFYRNLEQVLSQGVVPVQADVGSDCLVGDFGFDPLHLSDVDLFRPAQQFLLQCLIPSSASSTTSSTATTHHDEPPRLDDDEGTMMDAPKRPRALILRDYREAEIRHGRLAMLAAMIWPLQEMVDQFLLSEEQFGPLLYGPVTLPYFPLLMTAIMLLLGYLDIYSQAIKDMDQIGDAFLPGDCFWDPLQVLQGAPDNMRRNMQERELFNGRAAMIAIGAYIVEESITHKALINIGSNALLLQPAYEIPFIQQWLDQQFTLSQPTTGVEGDPTLLFTTPTADDNASMLLDTLDALVQSTMIFVHSILI